MTDLDQSGYGFQRVRTYLGPSLGWVDEFVQPSVEIKTAGVYTVKPGNSILLVNVAAGVTIQLPDVRAWMQQNAYQPSTGFDRSITVKDFGGNATSFNIVVAPFGQQFIDNIQQTTVISTARAAVKFIPLVDMSGWVVQSNVGASGGGGGGDVFKAGNNTFTGTNTFNGTTTVPTVAGADDSQNAASTAWVQSQGYVLPAALNAYALIASPTFTGDPKSNATLAVSDNDTSLATTAFVHSVVNTIPAGAPTTSQFILSVNDPLLPSNRVLTDSATITWDFTTPGQAKANSAAGGGNVSTSGSPAALQYARWVTGTTIEGRTPAQVRSDIGAQPAGSYQPLDGDLTALSGLTGTNTIYYRSAVDIWSPVTYSGLSFSGGVLTVTAGGGNVNNTGTPVAGQVAEWADATHIQGVSTYAKLASPVFTGNPQAPTPATSDNSISIATTAYVKANIAAASSSVAGVRGLTGLSTATVMSLSFSDCALRDNSGKTVLVINGNLVISTVAGAGANGPDATLPASGDIHFYAIWGVGPGIAGLCSTSAPPTGPAATMPSGYTHYCYLTTVKRVSSSLYMVVVRGDWVTFSQSVNVLTNGNSGGSWTSQSMAAALPAIALNVQLGIFATATATGAATLSHMLGHTSGQITYTIACNPQVAGTAATTGMFMLPNISQTFWYTFSIGGGTFSGSTFGVNVASYQVPNAN